MSDKAVIYARESEDDTSKAPPITEQIARGKQHAQENELEIVQVYEDNGYSGGDWNRPSYNQLIRDARRHFFKVVLVFNTDRIARDTEQFLYFQRNLKESHVKVFSLTEGNINLDTVGDTAKNISIAMANEIFRKVTSEKVKKAYSLKKSLANKHNTKVQWGRKAKEYDLDKIHSLRASGKGYRSIAKEMLCSYQTIRRLLLQNTPRENKGELSQNKTVIE